jgi:RNA polymerase sigma-70 factor (ECF subfamily)
MDIEGGEITALLKRLSAGDKRAADDLIPYVYQELRKMARIFMARERNAITLQPTALVHEVYLKLIGGTVPDWQNRAHFFAVAAQAMRHLLVDNARLRQAQKRGGRDRDKVALDHAVGAIHDPTPDVLEVDEALTRLAEVDPRQCRIVELRYFAGLTIEEIAEVLQLSPRTIKREWSMAKTWLYGQLSGSAVH